jgi:hypothetical protein
MVPAKQSSYKIHLPNSDKNFHQLQQTEVTFVRFQVLTAASMIFRVVFWDILPCKMIVHRRFRGRQSFYTAVYPRRQL